MQGVKIEVKRKKEFTEIIVDSHVYNNNKDYREKINNRLQNAFKND
jgi:hypothetical protein